MSDTLVFVFMQDAGSTMCLFGMFLFWSKSFVELSLLYVLCQQSMLCARFKASFLHSLHWHIRIFPERRYYHRYSDFLWLLLIKRTCGFCASSLQKQIQIRLPYLRRISVPRKATVKRMALPLWFFASTKPPCAACLQQQVWRCACFYFQRLFAGSFLVVCNHVLTSLGCMFDNYSGIAG